MVEGQHIDVKNESRIWLDGSKSQDIHLDIAFFVIITILGLFA
jgi:hypothetical protein